MIDEPVVPLAATRPAPRRRSRLFDLGAVTLAFVTGVAVLGIYASFRIWEVGRRDDRRPADAIVVLGAAQFNGTPSAVLAARLDHAIDLYRQGIAPYFVVTGGKLPGDRTTEAETERDYAIRHGVPPDAILVEDTGRTTLESMQNVRAIFARRGLRSAVFVSDRTHMLRVLTMAGDQGITAYGSPTATSPTDTDAVLHTESLQHELGALALYFLVEQGESTPPAPLSGRATAAGSGAAASPSPELRQAGGGPQEPDATEAVTPTTTSGATGAVASSAPSDDTEPRVRPGPSAGPPFHRPPPAGAVGAAGETSGGAEAAGSGPASPAAVEDGGHVGTSGVASSEPAASGEPTATGGPGEQAGRDR